VIGFTGSDDKVKWLVDELKFDAAFNYKTTDVVEALKQSAPEGVDCYFDNVSI
jgi:NADPH-dependent curcumin reductase CurA